MAYVNAQQAHRAPRDQVGFVADSAQAEPWRAARTRAGAG